ncbi:PLP-dependent aminotransferase family protein [Paenibacillus turpanensis]|uniref:aminotransferase-like domain-containing protein n=1 Tax=Paenibacillus turpanensis TaxID=2689078 RepID=UPI00140C1A51|nr:PLP-dependent aminotransferase family protein [Paenibacillus turpanensis]
MNIPFSKATEGLTSSAVREILKLTQGKSVISFAGGLPAEELFPIEAAKQAYNRVFEQGPAALQYNLTEGHMGFREKMCERITRKGIAATPAQMLVTTGSQQAIDLLCRVILDPGDTVLVDNPTYLAALQVLHSYQANVVPVASDADGMLPDDLEAKLKEHRPKLVYTTPTFSNPTGKVWSKERRLALVRLTQQHQALVLEDDPYGDIQFDPAESFPPIVTLAGPLDQSNVVYTSTFSKTVVPALRTGWVIGCTPVIQMMARAKQASDLHSSSLDQQALYHLLNEFDLDAHIGLIREQYRERMQLMVSILKEHSWPGVTWNEPKGGMFLWLELPESIHCEPLLKRCVEEGVAFVPGAPFYIGQPKWNTIRLNFTHTDRERMILGMQRFAKVMDEFVSAQPSGTTV